MEHPRTHSVAATANTPSNTRSSSIASSKNNPSSSSSSKDSGAATGASTTATTENTQDMALHHSIPSDIEDMDVDQESTSVESCIDPKTKQPNMSNCPSSASTQNHDENVFDNASMSNTNATISSSQHRDDTTGHNIMLPQFVSMKDYTEGFSNRDQFNTGTVTPSMNDNNQNRNGSNIFKPFDTKTGQFLKSENTLASPSFDSGKDPRENSYNNNNNNDNVYNQPVPIKTSIQDNNNNITMNRAIEANQMLPSSELNENRHPHIIPSFKVLSSIKSRSYSVPTILHSSLKRLTTTNHYAKLNNNIMNASINNHPMSQPYSIMKKKSNKGSPYISSSNNTLSSNLVYSPNSSLKRAILLSQHVINTNNNNNNINKFLETITKIRSLNNGNAIVTIEDRINYIKATALPVPLPPINLQCLKEIDLQEIVKNPQLRHDIIFDPLLQFRPNLDGERGIKKRQLSDKYWNDVENEIFVYLQKPEVFQYNHSRLVPLFDTLRDVLLTIVPQKESHQIINILDTELKVQELVKGSLNIVNFSDWLATLFKHHCAPMRDSWVDRMNNKFKEADAEGSLPKLAEGLKLIFQILEAMKLDIANHQIRLLRPALLSNSVEFEKQYFNSLMNSKKIILNSSLLWFNNKFDEYITKEKEQITIPQIYRTSIKSIISLLSCRKMVREYPTSLSFDHARLVLLRADIRQIVCLMVCRLLFQQLVANDETLDLQTKNYVNTTYKNQRLKNEIISIITDEHGNCRWTKNTLSISVHLCKVINDLKNEYKNTTNEPLNLNNDKITFAKTWLSKQTQPLSEVYGVLENRVFKLLEEKIFNNSGCTIDGRVKQDFVYLYSTTTENKMKNSSKDIHTNSTSAATSTTSTTTKPPTTGGTFEVAESEEFENIYRHLYTIINLHWSVFGNHYIDSLGDKIFRKGL
ncbi:hypothetical protein KAFR_0A01300 [Kazachstania africana CBS 2517]|uniref:Uncharacterized protein n=1 Tax=Kazachstania africana (strain ATCC 22294 / BCRC 22015 / CBS 2517 / CECT 1963 / NBRC 1671 / NRRL Y-8276) TaxID=1071382 RepID=H2AMG8_KAZAF|nr:hypothetical protein KAFR_0A01300 [Kazachstania africana CBS 2517]CCF55568.1 hypothetical protein KAFR_0A01300 [Kazachstania africana CBS 2517]